MARELGHTEEILNLLDGDRVHGAYAIADLEPEMRANAQYFTTDAVSDALLLVYRTDAFNAVWLTGHAGSAAVLLDEVDLPTRFHFIIEPRFLNALRARHRLSPEPPEAMIRMVVSRESFRPAGSRCLGEAVVVGGAPPEELDRFYAGRTPAWSPDMARQGVYVVVRQGGHILAAAGTHVVSPSYGLATIGNVFTEPTARGRGLGTAATSALVERLLPRFPDVLLNVAVENVTAVRIYERLGFSHHEELAEGVAESPRPERREGR